MRWIGLLSGALLALAGGCAGWTERGQSSAVIGFYCTAGAQQQEVEKSLAAQLSGKGADFIARLGPDAGTGAKWVVRWPFPSASTPVARSSHDYGYSFERGPLHVAVIETEEPMAEHSPAYLWLTDDLSLTSKPWKVVVMPRPIFSFDPARADRERLDLADLLAREGVALAIATGGAGYSRSARIGASLRESVHYVVLGPGASANPGPSVASAPPSARPEWVARAIAENYCCELEVRKGRLRWSVFDAEGRRVDLLELLPAAPAAGQAKVFTTSEVLAGERDQESGAGNEKK